MTNEEVICSYMEPSPPIKSFRIHYSGNEDGQDEQMESPLRWWVADTEEKKITPRTLTLVECWKVQERLTKEQGSDYINLILEMGNIGDAFSFMWELVHATAEQKVKALAEIIRKQVG
jgi:hypothetical protein